MTNLVKITFIIFILILPCFSEASEIFTGPIPHTSSNYIVISGEIRPNDEIRFNQIAQNISNGVVVLASPGGSVIPALEIGKIISERGFKTMVPDNTLCASSCALIWIAGKEKFLDDSSVLGFHAAHIFKEGIAYESGVGNALIGAYLNDLGLSTKAIIFITTAPPEGIAVLDKKTGIDVGIAYSFLSTGDDLLQKQSLELKNEPYNPVGAVAAFYKALSHADGNIASSYVVPSKRGIGPFNEENIFKFYSQMKKPLQVKNIEQINFDTVIVNYVYTKTKTSCEGRAIVKTEYYMGNTLIRQIQANC
ncbi:MAG: hypothetical protein CMH28_10635 [Micavibrio sp.]|nr:hypothetical protein [Micavibrio sp.]|tara:strand:- start:2617 stop:3537 length:921 start_codon:yes stop_codon:yes gene_type:complete